MVVTPMSSRKDNTTSNVRAFTRLVWRSKTLKQLNVAGERPATTQYKTTDFIYYYFTVGTFSFFIQQPVFNLQT